jgi:hypothetical protein
MNLEKSGFIHHVFFWLKNPESKEDLNQLLVGLKKLSKITAIKEFHTGVPANTKREVIDSSYSATLLLLFESVQDHDSYQKDPVHLKFVEECSQLWSKVVIYDTVPSAD